MGKKKKPRENSNVITSFLIINHLSNCNKLLCLTSINIQFLFFSYICDHSYIIPYKSRLMVMFQRAQLKQNDIKGLIWPSVKVWGTIMVFPAKEAGCWYIIRGMETLVFFLDSRKPHSPGKRTLWAQVRE
jgi:hypothetical protein